MAALMFVATSCEHGPRVAIEAVDGSKRATVKIEVADTEQKREVGLMYRKHLDDDAGMLFIFPQPLNAVFWMKNTEIPLDMIFADSSGRVNGVIANARPFSEEYLSVPGAISTYVLEVNGGFCQRRGVKVGDQFKFIEVSSAKPQG